MKAPDKMSKMKETAATSKVKLKALVYMKSKKVPLICHKASFVTGSNMKNKTEN